MERGTTIKDAGEDIPRNVTTTDAKGFCGHETLYFAAKFCLEEPLVVLLQPIHKMSEARKAEIRKKLDFSFGCLNSATGLCYVLTCKGLEENEALSNFLQAEVLPGLCEKYHASAVAQAEKCEDGYRVFVWLSLNRNGAEGHCSPYYGHPGRRPLP